MSVPLLSTKLYIPPLRPNRVPRQRLIECLHSGAQRKLTLISAPAGFGKTTLLSEWARQCGVPVAWLSLDQSDNDFARFVTYFSAALQTVLPGVGEAAQSMLRPPQPASGVSSNQGDTERIELMLTALINDLADMRQRTALVLDDYHVITARPIQDALSFLLDHLPPLLHVVIASRADPPLALARWRAGGYLTELRASDLRFTPDETAAFLNTVMGLDVSAEDVAALEHRTEGWIVGLQMAALSMRGRDDVSGFVRAFTGSHRFILDYLVEEVLDRQPPVIQDFLLKTSVLERMTAPLCDAIIGGSDSQRILVDLDQANVFLVPLDDERRWFRYHHLFADLLRSRLAQTRPDPSSLLHRRAGEWYEQHGFAEDAVSHSLAAGDFDRAAHLIEVNALTMMAHGELGVLEKWMAALPDEMMKSRPWLCVHQAWLRAYTGQLNAVEPLLLAIETMLEGLDTHETRRIRGYVAALRAYCTCFTPDLSRAGALAREALDALSEEDLMMRSRAAKMLGYVLRLDNDYDGAAQALREAVALSRATGDSHDDVEALCELALLRREEGRLREAAATCRDALQRAEDYVRQTGQRMPIAACAHVYLSVMLREWNEVDEALRHVREGLDLCRRWGQLDMEATAYISLSAALQAAGDLPGSLAAIEKAKQLVRNYSSTYTLYAGAYEAHTYLAQGDVKAAARWAEQFNLRPDDEISVQYKRIYVVFARVLVAQGRLDEALALLAKLQDAAEETKATGYLIEILVVRAMTLRALSRMDDAIAALKRALTLAEPEGYVRTFVDQGEPMAALLRMAAARGIAVDYVNKLLVALKAESRIRGGQLAAPSTVASLPEPLSERELQVLRLLPTSLSGQEIADELCIAESTVRSHIKSIYGKLNVHRRNEAVERAKELDLT